MKLNKFLFILLFGVVVLTTNSCNDDESPKLVFVTAEGTYELKGAKLYLSNSDTYTNDNGTVDYRDYFITDGTFAGGGLNPWSLSDYTDASFYIAFELAVPQDEEFSPGQYPIIYDWGTAPNAKFSYFYMQLEGSEYFDTPSSGSLPTLTVGGGFDDGETLSFKFKGRVTYGIFVDGTWETSTEEATFFFKGKVEDKRLL